MSEIEDDIDGAIAVLEMSPAGWGKLSPPQAHKVCQAAKDQFVMGNPRAWWLGLKHQAERHEFPNGDGCEFIRTLVPSSDERCWFVPETEEDDLPVYDALVAEVPRVLGRCRFFEYYLIGKNLDWLVIENDHNEVLVVKVAKSG